MCDRNVLNEVTERVRAAAVEVLGGKLEKLVLFGSYARGDYDDESDVDIMVLAGIAPEDVDKVRDSIRDRMGYLSLEYGVLVCLHIVCGDVYRGCLNASRFFMNVRKDGVELYAA